MTTTRRNRPTLITDAPERRSIASNEFEIRDDEGDDNALVLTGYASTFQPYEMYGGPANGGWIEQIDPHAFDKTLREKPDLHLLINHAGMPLARTKSGTLTLGVDGHGLRVESPLDRTDPDVQRLEPKMRRKDMDEMSFAFRVKAQEWSVAPGYEDLDDDMSLRKITEVSLHKGDVSVVNFGANPTTHADIRSTIDALEMLANSDADDLAEVRSDADLIRRARVVFDSLLKPESEAGDDRSEEVSIDSAVEVLSPNAQDVVSEMAEIGAEALAETLGVSEPGEVSDPDTGQGDSTPADDAPEVTPEEREITTESILADIESAGLMEALLDAFRELLGVVAEDREEEVTDEVTDEPVVDPTEEEAPSRGISLRLAMALAEE